jgi:hypothetical protein
LESLTRKQGQDPGCTREYNHSLILYATIRHLVTIHLLIFGTNPYSKHPAFIHDGSLSTSKWICGQLDVAARIKLKYFKFNGLVCTGYYTG